MHDSTQPDTGSSPFASESSPFEGARSTGSPFDPPSSRQPAPDPTLTPSPVTVTAFDGRTPGRGSAIRAGIVLGCALVVALGSAVVLGASPSQTTSGAGAAPSAAASPNAANPNGKGNGSGGRFGPFGGFGPFAFGPGGPATVPFVGRGFGGDGQPGGIGGGKITVTGVSGLNISLKTDDGWTRTITLTSDTKITKGGEAATLADVSAGDVVRFREKKNADGTYTITALAIVLPQTGGTVTGVTSDTIVIKRRDGTSQTIKTTGNTKYHRDGDDGKRTDVTVGATVIATGEQAADGTITADSVTVILPRVAGTVTAVGSNTITLKRRDGTTVTVHVGSSTTLRVPGVDNAKLSDVTAGMSAVVVGSQRSDGSLDATSVLAGNFGKGNGQKPAKPKQGAPKAAPTPSAATS